MQKNAFLKIIWILLFIVLINMGSLSGLASSMDSDTVISEDPYMTTNDYDVDIQVREDNTYQVTENLDVSFLTPRHGIYRYIPETGSVIESNEDGQVETTLYYADIDLISSNQNVYEETEGGNQVYRFGDEEQTVTEEKYQFTYEYIPRTTNGFTNAYYNIYSGKWQDAIPAGSTFTIQFPKEFDHTLLQFYYGAVGTNQDAAPILDLVWDGNTVTGTIKEELAFGSALTFYAPMEEGYFVGVHTTRGVQMVLILISVISLAVVMLLFFLFGKDETMITSIQYQPPADLDSAAVGYIIDGIVDDKDLISLIVYWADKGYLKIKDPQEEDLALVKIRDIPEDAPAYARTIFHGIFGAYTEVGIEVKISDLKYKFADTIAAGKTSLRDKYKGIYTKASQAAQIIGVILAIVPFGAFIVVTSVYSPSNSFGMFSNLLFFVINLAGIIVLAKTVDTWHVKSGAGRTISTITGVGLSVGAIAAMVVHYGIRMAQGNAMNFMMPMIVMAVVSVAMMFMAAFMKKRTHQCVEWMGRLLGLREFIETAELDRMKVIAQDNPNLFYHILPYAYVFGLSDVFMKKMDALKLPNPDWYVTGSTNGNMPTFFDYYLMHRLFYVGLPTATKNLNAVKVESASYGSRGGFGGGSFGGGGFGGGFSGGGFGGGGGGSW